MAGEEEGNHIDPLALTPIVVDLKIKSEDAENILKKEMDSYMKSEKMVALNKKAEDSRLEYELKKSRLTELMIDNDVTEIKTKNGGSVRIMVNGDKKKLKVTPKR